MRTTMSFILAGVAAIGAAVALAGPATETAAAGDCMYGPYVKLYLSKKVRFAPDVSYLRLTWQPKFCRNGKTWDAEGGPQLKPTGTGSAFGKGLDLDHPRHWPNSVAYQGEVRQCLPASISYRGFSLSGTGCFTQAKLRITAWVEKGRIRYSVPTPRANGNDIGGFVWTRSVL